MKNILVTILMLSSLMLGISNSQTTKALKPKSFDKELKKDNGVLIDVRTPKEYAEEHLKGATMIDYKDSTFSEKVSMLNKNKPVYLYCHSGKRSAAAQDTLIKQGFKKVVALKGGITKWKDSGMPVEK